MKIKILFIYFLLFASLSSNAQDSISVSKRLQRLNWDMQLGTSLSFYQGFGSVTSYYASPSLSFQLNDRWAAHTGIIIGTAVPMRLNMNERERAISAVYTSVYGAFSYRLTNNIILYGSGLRSFGEFNNNSPFSYPAFNEISFGSSFKIGDNVTIGASMHFREYRNIQDGFFSPVNNLE